MQIASKFNKTLEKQNSLKYKIVIPGNQNLAAYLIQ